MSKPKVAIIIQARMGSTRLPGKVLKQVLSKPLLEYQLERIKRVKNADEVVVATTQAQNDDPIVDLCSRLNVNVFRGSEHDVLKRYVQAAQNVQADVVVRLTADNPLIDPIIVEKAILYFTSNGFDYISNCMTRTFPRGMEVEVCSRTALERADKQAHSRPEREHVTLYLYEKPGRFKIGELVANPPLAPELRLTVDTEADFLLIEKVLTALYPQQPHFTLKEVLKLLDQHPEWKGINQSIRQKAVRVQPKIVFIDLDGTLVNSLKPLFNTYLSLCRRFGVEGTRQEFADLNGVTIAEAAVYLKNKYNFPLEADQLFELYMEELGQHYVNDSTLMPGVNEFIHFARAHNLRLAIVTAASANMAGGLIERLNLSADFEAVITSDEVQSGKPAPDLYLCALEVTKTTSDEALAIEDSDNGIRSAESAGINTLKFGSSEFPNWLSILNYFQNHPWNAHV